MYILFARGSKKNSIINSNKIIYEPERDILFTSKNESILKNIATVTSYYHRFTVIAIKYPLVLNLKALKRWSG